jgi:hypothetical protein
MYFLRAGTSERASERASGREKLRRRIYSQRAHALPTRDGRELIGRLPVQSRRRNRRRCSRNHGKCKLTYRLRPAMRKRPELVAAG